MTAASWVLGVRVRGVERLLPLRLLLVLLTVGVLAGVALVAVVELADEFADCTDDDAGDDDNDEKEDDDDDDKDDDEQEEKDCEGTGPVRSVTTLALV